MPRAPILALAAALSACAATQAPPPAAEAPAPPARIALLRAVTEQAASRIGSMSEEEVLRALAGLPPEPAPGCVPDAPVSTLLHRPCADEPRRAPRNHRG